MYEDARTEPLFSLLKNLTKTWAKDLNGHLHYVDGKKEYEEFNIICHVEIEI